MKISQYRQIGYQQYKEQVILKMRLRNFAYLNSNTDIGRRVLSKVNQMINYGVYFQRVERSGYVIEPIYGDDHWRDENHWREFIKTLLADKEIFQELTYMLNRLPDIINRTAYLISCENRKSECDKIHNSCLLSNCKIGLAELENKIRKSYENMQIKSLNRSAQDAI